MASQEYVRGVKDCWEIVAPNFPPEERDKIYESVRGLLTITITPPSIESESQIGGLA